MSELKNKAALGVKWTAINSIANVTLGPLTLTILEIYFGCNAVDTVLRCGKV